MEAIDRQQIGEQIFYKIYERHPQFASKLTGMFLENDLSLVVPLLNDNVLFEKEVATALAVLVQPAAVVVSPSAGVAAWSDLVGSAPVSSGDSVRKIDFDEDLDSSRMGLPLLLKTTKVTPTDEADLGQKRLRPEEAVVVSEVPSAAAAAESKAVPVAMKDVSPPLVHVPQQRPKKQKNAATISANQAPANLIPNSNSQAATSIVSPDSQKPFSYASAVQRSATAPSLISDSTPLAAAAVSFPSASFPSTPTPARSASMTSVSVESASASAPVSPSAAGDVAATAALLSPEQKLEQRTKQLDWGYQTSGYKTYSDLVPKFSRDPKKATTEHPRTPNKFDFTLSKRSWDGKLRIWRRLLHQYDDSTENGQGGAGVETEESALAASSE